MSSQEYKDCKTLGDVRKALIELARNEAIEAINEFIANWIADCNPNGKDNVKSNLNYFSAGVGLSNKFISMFNFTELKCLPTNEWKTVELTYKELMEENNKLIKDKEDLYREISNLEDTISKLEEEEEYNIYKPNKKEFALFKNGEWRNDPELKKNMETKYLDLREADLYKADLYKADLTEADLREANLYKADLTEACFFGAILYKAYLREAYLRGAILIRADLREANLAGAYLADADLREANLAEANFTNAIIDKNNFDKYIDKSIWECENVYDNIVRMVKRIGETNET